VQAFEKIPALKALAPAQTEPPFKLTQLSLLVVSTALAIVAVIRFRPRITGLPQSERTRSTSRLMDSKKRTETEVADAMGVNQSSINRRKRAILNILRTKLSDRDKFQRFSA